MIVETPVLDDDAVGVAVEDHRAEVDSLASGGNAKKLPLVSALVTQLERDPVVLCDQVLDRRVEVGEGTTPGTNPGLRLLGEFASGLIDNIEEAAVEGLIDKPVNVRLVGLDLGRLAHQDGIMRVWPKARKHTTRAL